MTTANRCYPANAFRVCVDNIKDDISGRIYTPLAAEAIPFISVGEILVKMDELFDSFGYPQAFQDKRSFDKGKGHDNLYRGIPKKEQCDSTILSQLGEAATFDLVIKSRQNTSWQGEVLNIEGEIISKFDGEVELLAGLIEMARTEQ